MLSPWVPCEVCDGSGEELVDITGPFDREPVEQSAPCDGCGGDGEVWIEGEPDAPENP